MKIILFNGPPHVGKDTAAEILVQRLGADRIGFADHLKEATHAAYGMFGLPWYHFQAVKDMPREEFLGLTPRRAYILHSENYIKPIHGNDFFGKMFLRRAASSQAKIIGVPDSGFKDEATPVVEKYGRENVALVRLHRKGCSFAGDSRGYIDLDIQSFEVENDKTINDLAADIKRIADWLLAGGEEWFPEDLAA